MMMRGINGCVVASDYGGKVCDREDLDTQIQHSSQSGNKKKISEVTQIFILIYQNLPYIWMLIVIEARKYRYQDHRKT